MDAKADKAPSVPFLFGEENLRNVQKEPEQEEAYEGNAGIPERRASIV